jgi:hypothetical protein
MGNISILYMVSKDSKIEKRLEQGASAFNNAKKKDETQNTGLRMTLGVAAISWAAKLSSFDT